MKAMAPSRKEEEGMIVDALSNVIAGRYPPSGSVEMNMRRCERCGIVGCVWCPVAPAIPTQKKRVNYKGVRQRQSGRWAAEIRDPQNKRTKWLGTFDTPEEAAMAHDRAAIDFNRLKARTNFPLYIYSLPDGDGGTSSQPQPQPPGGGGGADEHPYLAG